MADDKPVRFPQKPRGRLLAFSLGFDTDDFGNVRANEEGMVELKTKVLYPDPEAPPAEVVEMGKREEDQE